MVQRRVSYKVVRSWHQHTMHAKAFALNDPAGAAHRYACQKSPIKSVSEPCDTQKETTDIGMPHTVSSSSTITWRWRRG